MVVDALKRFYKRYLRAEFKRAIDSSLALVGLVALAPVLSIIAIGVKVSSPGPVLYKAQRRNHQFAGAYAGR